MHHLIYPSQDTFVTDTLGFEDLNFGIDEILRVGTQNITTKVLYPTTSYPVQFSSSYMNVCVQGFSGSLGTASFYGSASSVWGHIFNTSVDPVSFAVDRFSGSFVGSAVGYESGSYISASNATGSFSAFSGTIVVHTLVSGSTWDGLIQHYNNWETTWETVLSGSGSIDGWLSGSLSGSFIGIFNGTVSGFTGKILIGDVYGWNIKNVPHSEVIINPYRNRALVQFDIDAISASMASGDIINPEFRLKLNVAREFELPIRYMVYAFPISESWVMGDGYISDDGSPYGASWLYRDKQGGTPWATTGSSYIQTMSVTQSFNYQVGDINMDVTPIVNAWVSGTIPNNGIVLMSSDEFAPTGSGMGLYFFSKDTNTIYEPVLDVGWNQGSGGWSWSTGSVSVSSVTMGNYPAGLLGRVVESGSVSGSLWGGITGIANLQVSCSVSYSISGSETQSFTSCAASGLVSAYGVNGLILSMSIIGNMSGSLSSSYGTASIRCGTCTPPYSAPFIYPGGQIQTQYQGHDIYGWGDPFNEFNQYDWYSWGPYQVEFGPNYTAGPCPHATASIVTMSFVMGTFIDGTMPGATFTSSFVNGYQLGYGWLVGAWNEGMIRGAGISASYPFQPFFPSATNVVFTGPYLVGPAFGSITSLIMGVTGSGIFDGVFTGGPLVGVHMHTPFSGSVLTASVAYTASVTLTSSSLSPVNFGKPFVTVIQNIPSTVKAGNIIRVNVFARPEFPLKNFNRQTQFTQFLTPQYLPTSSYYAIKDNETEQIILGFDNYTQLSCDTNGNYFMLDTTGFPQERYFKLLIKTEDSGSIYTFDKGNIFKIVR